MKKLINSPKSIIIVIAILFVTSVGYAQPTFPGGGDDIEDEAPITSLLALGLAAGAVFGIRKLK